MGTCSSSKKNIDRFDVPQKNFFEFEINDIEGNLIKLQKFQGKKAFICVNVACSCKLTTQNYTDLVEIDQGLEIFGFPCNQFKNQESKPEPEIKDYVTKKYGVHFPLFQKIFINGEKAHEIYKFLRYNSELKMKNNNEIKHVPWNFAKFLLDSDGNVIKYYNPEIQPHEMIKDIEILLKK